MPSNKDFDEILKNKFENFEAPLPNGGWNNIKNKIPEKRKKNFFLMPFMMAASVLMTILSGYFFIKSNDSTPNNIQSNEQSSVNIKFDSNVNDNIIALNNQTQQFNSESNDLDNLNSSTNDNYNQSEDNNTTGLNSETSIVEQNNYEDNSLLVNSNNVSESGSQITTSLIALNNNQINNPTKNTSNHINTIEESTSSNGISSISLIPLRNTDLLAVNGRNAKLTEAIEIDDELLATSITNEGDEKDNEKKSKFHYGITASPIYTTKRMIANENDKVNVSQYKGLNKFNKKRTGYSIGIISNYNINSRISLIGALSCTNLSDENTYYIAEKTNNPIIKERSENSYSFSTTKEIEKTTTSILHYVEVETGAKFLLLENKGVYFKGSAGLSKLLYAKSSEGDSFNDLNYNTAFAFGREYKLGKFKLCIEPEVTYYLKSYQNEGEVMVKPTTFGINFIAIR